MVDFFFFFFFLTDRKKQGRGEKVREEQEQPTGMTSGTVRLGLGAKEATNTAFTLGQKSSSTSIRSSSISVYDKCKQVQVDLGRIKKVKLFEKSKLLFSNLFFKISRIIVIDLHFFCSVNRSRNQIHVHQA